MSHWRAMMDSPYLGSWDLPDGQDRVFTIDKVTSGEVTNAQKKTQRKPLVHFVNCPKPLVANVTNCKTIARLYGDRTEDWVGKRVQLYIAETSVGGETVPCLRVRSKAPGEAKKTEAKS